MRKIEKKIQSDTTKSHEYLEEESSSGESTDDAPFYDDLNLNIDLFIKGKQILDNCDLTIQRNHKYGLVGRNGIGKTTLIKAIRKRKFGIPKGLKIHAIRQDYTSDERVIDYVLGKVTDDLKGGAESSQKTNKNNLFTSSSTKATADYDEAGAKKVLRELGFTEDLEQQTIRNLSGGWRMRTQLARAIHLNPDLVLLDEPTNFLDLKAIAYLESRVKNMKTVIIVSHDRNFLDSVVDHVLYMNDMKIEVYEGNYSKFKQIRTDRISRLMKEYENDQAQRAHLQSFIDRFRYNASRAAQAQSKIKMLEKMPIISLPKVDPAIKFSFPSTPIRGTILELTNVSFGYAEKPIFKHLNFRITHSSRIVIVGENGQGKSTLLKLLANSIRPTEGSVESSPDLRIGYFAQHHVDHLDHDEHVLSFMMKTLREEEARSVLSRFGLNVKNQKIGTLSGGQKSRLAFALMSLNNPNLLILDEPTNHLDMETIEALADAVGNFDGAVVCVSHDLSFIQQAFSEVYICENGKLELFKGSAKDYKDSIKASF